MINEYRFMKTILPSLVFLISLFRCAAEVAYQPVDVFLLFAALAIVHSDNGLVYCKCDFQTKAA